MKKDRKIQDFITANKPEVSDSGQFMESLKEQMDLLPTPASLTEPENIDGQEWLVKLRAGMKASFRRDVAWVVGSSVAVLCVAVVAYFLFFANTGITIEMGNNLETSLKNFSHLPYFYIIFGLILVAISLLICIPVLSRDDDF